jgi:hypothetical protein
VDTPVLSTNKADRHNITEISLKVALNTITPISVFYIRINNLQSSKVETTRDPISMWFLYMIELLVLNA